MKAEKLFKPYAFLAWLDGFTQIREGRNNLLSQKINTPSLEDGKEELEQRQKNADGDSIKIKGSTSEEIFDNLPKLKKLKKKIQQKTTEKGNCLSKKRHLEEKQFTLIKSLQRDIVGKRRKQEDQKKEKSAEELCCL